MELLQVRMCDVVPDENNIRKTFEGIEELAESFKGNAARPGEPDNPPKLVRDGNRFRIADGERRYRAMQLIGTEVFTAIVEGTYSELEAARVQLATNNKRELPADELSHGVQQVLMLGLDPDEVDATAGLKKGSARRVQKAMGLVGQRAEQMSLDRLFAIADFEGDEDAVERLSKCADGDVQREVERIRAARARQERAAALRAKAEELGIELMSDKDAMAVKGHRFDYRLTACTPDELAESYASRPDAVFGVNADGTSVYAYVPDEAKEKSAEEVELEKRAVELADAIDAAIRDLSEWFAQRATTLKLDPIPEVMSIVADAFCDYVGYDELLDSYPELCGDVEMSRIDLAIGFRDALPFKRCSRDKALKIMKGTFDWQTSDVLKLCDLLDAAEFDGFEFREETEPAKAALAAFREGIDEA